VFHSTTVISGPGTLKVKSFAVATGSALDLADSSLVVDYDGVSPLADLEWMIATGFAGGGQTGPGIRTSAGTASMRLGIAEAGETPFGTLYNGHSLDSTSLIIRYTVAGDANLNGTVSLDDFTNLAAAFGAPGGWARGDFNYDGQVTLDDFTTLAANFGASVPANTAHRSVPEPTSSLALFGLSTGLLIRRRRA
jgi:hypothetical protein